MIALFQKKEFDQFHDSCIFNIFFQKIIVVLIVKTLFQRVGDSFPYLVPDNQLLKD